MRGTAFAVVIAGLALFGISNIAQAAPIAPPAAAAAADYGNVTQVQWWWRRHHHRHWCYYHPRRCGW